MTQDGIAETLAQTMREFCGWLSADIPELHQVEVPRLADSLDRFLALRVAGARPQEPPQWPPAQAIESAPEAMYVLVFLPSYGWIRAIRTQSYWWSTALERHGEIVYPTHWLPEPPRPNAAAPAPLAPREPAKSVLAKPLYDLQAFITAAAADRESVEHLLSLLDQVAAPPPGPTWTDAELDAAIRQAIVAIQDDYYQEFDRTARDKAYRDTLRKVLERRG